MKDLLRRLYELIDENCRPGETVLVAHCLDLASRVHQDKHGTPVASVAWPTEVTVVEYV